MALLFCDGFDHYATADMNKKWTTVIPATPGLGFQIGASGRRASAGELRASLNVAFLSKTLPQSATLIMGVAYRIESIPTSAVTIFVLLDAGTTQCALYLMPDGTLRVARSNSPNNAIATSTVAITSGAYYYIEWKVTISDSTPAGSCKVRINGAEVINAPAGLDTKNSTNSYANQVRLGNIESNSIICQYDDFYVCDNTGATNNDFLGDVRIDTLIPNGDGTYSEWTPSTGTSHFALVDEATPNTTDYVSSATVGTRDTFALTNLPPLTSQIVYGVQVNAALSKDDAGAKSAATMVRAGSSNANAAAVPLGTSQVYASQMYETNPDGAAAWTEATVNAMEAGVIVTA